MKLNTVSIRSGSWTAELCPDFGMNPVSLRHEGKPILREPADAEALAASPLLYGIPPLFPANRTKDATFVFDGVRYTLPMNEKARSNNLHGCLYHTLFKVVEVKEDTVVSTLKNTDEYFPFPFTMTFTDSVSPVGYRKKIEIHNDGDKPMPVTLSFHSTFVEPESFSVKVGQRFETDPNYIPTGTMLPLNGPEGSFNTSCHPHGIRINGYYTSLSNVARVGEYLYAVSENFDEWIFFNNTGNEGYLCVEPQSGKVNGLNCADGHTRLAPGQSLFYSLAITKA